MNTITISTQHRDQFVNITSNVQEEVAESRIDSGSVLVYVPHTTAGITINESADPDVVKDMIRQLDKMVPWRQPFYQHAEGNSASHVKASFMGSSVRLLVEGGQLVLGTWQGIFFCEFDGPRQRSVYVKIMKD